jgi:hypothetical protein
VLVRVRGGDREAEPLVCDRELAEPTVEVVAGESCGVAQVLAA